MTLRDFLNSVPRLAWILLTIVESIAFACGWIRQGTIILLGSLPPRTGPELFTPTDAFWLSMMDGEELLVILAVVSILAAAYWLGRGARYALHRVRS